MGNGKAQESGAVVSEAAAVRSGRARRDEPHYSFDPMMAVIETRSTGNRCSSGTAWFDARDGGGGTAEETMLMFRPAPALPRERGSTNTCSVSMLFLTCRNGFVE